MAATTMDSSTWVLKRAKDAISGPMAASTQAFGIRMRCPVMVFSNGPTAATSKASSRMA